MFNRTSKTREPDSFEHANNYALFLLNLRLRTEGEMKEKMRERGYTASVIEAVITDLQKQNFINDARFAEVFIRSLLEHKNFGFYMIKKKLMEKRLPMPLIEEQLANLISIADEHAVAQRYLSKQGLELSTDLAYEARQKIAYKLKTRGFRSDVISKILSGQVPDID